MTRRHALIAAAALIAVPSLLVAGGRVRTTAEPHNEAKVHATTSLSPTGTPAARAGGRLSPSFDPHFFGRTWKIRGKLRERRAVNGRAVLAIDTPGVLGTPMRFRDEGRNVAALGVLVVASPNAVITRQGAGRVRFADLRAADLLVVTGRFVKPRRQVQRKGGPLILTVTTGRIESTRASAAPPSDYPSATTTGVPPGTNLRSSGAITVSTAGTVLDGLDIRGSLTINASNVIVRRSRVTVGDYWPIKIAEGLTGVRIEDVEVNGLGVESGSGAISGPATILRANIHDTADGIVAYSGSVIRDSYIHGLNAPSGAHFDGIVIAGDVRDVVIDHNSVANKHDQTSAVFIGNTWGAVDNITVSNNRLIGGGYTVYSDAKLGGGPITGVTFTGNRLGRGYWGYAVIRGNAVRWQGNVDDVTGKTVPSAGSP